MMTDEQLEQMKRAMDIVIAEDRESFQKPGNQKDKSHLEEHKEGQNQRQKHHPEESAFKEPAITGTVIPGIDASKFFSNA